MASWSAQIRAAAAAAAAACDTTVTELSGFANRGHADPGRLTGTILHDTITPSSWSSSKLSALLRDGYAGLPGPIANVQLDRDGHLVLIAARKAHHAGTGSYAGIASGNANAVGIEAANNGRPEVWTPVQRSVGIAFAAELHRAAGIEYRTVIGHKEWAAGRKVDPWSLDMAQIRAAVRARLTDPEPEDDMTDADRKLLRDIAARLEKLERRVGTRNDDRATVLYDLGKLRVALREVAAEVGIATEV